MEKTKGTYQSLLDSIFEEVRTVARRITDASANTGTIKISVRPLVAEADTFFGGVGRFDQKVQAGFGHCISVPDDLVCYEYSKPLELPVVEDKKIIKFSTGATASHTSTVLIQKKTKMKIDIAEGSVSSYSEWARISVTVTGGPTKRENMECASVLKTTVEKFFEEYSKIYGDADNVWSVNEQKRV